MRKRWVYINGEAVPADEAQYAPVSAIVMPDIQPYRSMVDGSIISSRSRHREHLRAHGVVEVGNEKMTYKAPAPPPGLKETIIAVANEKLRYK